MDKLAFSSEIPISANAREANKVKNSIRGKVAIVGIGESTYYKHGQAPSSEFRLCLDAIFAAAKDAGIAVTDIDGFSSYADDRNDPARLAHALSIKQVNYSVMQWGGGGTGCMAAITNAAAGIVAGYSDYVVVHRALAQGQFGRYGQAYPMTQLPGEFSYTAPYGVLSAAQMFSMRVHRFMHEHGVKQSALRAVALACYEHAQKNPRAIMYGKPLSAEQYDSSRIITEPFHLYDLCQENDGAAALILTSMERAKETGARPIAILGGVTSSQAREGIVGGISYYNSPYSATANMKVIAEKAYSMAGVGPKDIDVVQSYDHFTGGVVMSLVDHGLCPLDEINEFFTKENLTAPSGLLPINTSGGHLAECYVHGLSLVNEAVRQLRGESFNQVPGAKTALCIGGALGAPSGNLILGREG